MKTCILPIGHKYDHLFVKLKSGPTPSQCAKPEPCDELCPSAQHYCDKIKGHPGKCHFAECLAFGEADIPAEWRNDLFTSYGEIQEPFTPEESDAVELDRR